TSPHSTPPTPRPPPSRDTTRAASPLPPRVVTERGRARRRAPRPALRHPARLRQARRLPHPLVRTPSDRAIHRGVQGAGFPGGAGHRAAAGGELALLPVSALLAIGLSDRTSCIAAM